MVDDEIAESCVSEIAGSSPFGKDAISYEIQDDSQFVLLSVVTDGVVTLHQETVPLRSRESGMIFTI